jgi:hypothetical protein
MQPGLKFRCHSAAKRFLAGKIPLPAGSAKLIHAYDIY